jgi:MFS family permease
MAFLVKIAEDSGVSNGAAAGLFIAMSVVSTITRFGVPIAADRLGSKGAMAFCFFMQSAPIIILVFAVFTHDAWMFYLFAVLFGIGFGGEMSAFPIINRQYYGSAPIGSTYGWQMMGAGIGMAAGVTIGGLLHDLTGSWTPTIAVSFALSLTGVASIWVLPTTSRHQLPHWEDSLPQEVRSVTSG